MANNTLFLTVTISFIILLFIYGFLTYYAINRQQLIFFQPSPEMIESPLDHIPHGVWQDLYYWYMNEFPNRPVILFFHGSSKNVSHYTKIIDMSRKYNYNVLLSEYRGYGKSKYGKFAPNEKTLYKDGQTAYDFITKHHKIPHTHIIVWGNSLGGLPASYIAANNKIGALVLFSTFANPDLIISGYRGQLRLSDKILYQTVKPFLYRMDIVNNLARVKAPTLVLHGEDDEVICYDNAIRNYTCLKKNNGDNVEFIKISGTHAKPELTPFMVDSLVSFLRKNVG